ncbi:MAG TPA: hypothetical protein VGS27_12370 [Candidatus Sulfotelmatobacter sp.]|nr:hypothetical protein [Candidatus Sulfotelmatobacter sp.]
MLQAHSFLWHYLWVAPNLFLILLGLALLKRGFLRVFPAFLAFAFLSSLGDLATYSADVIPSATPETFWRLVWASLVVESLLKFLVIGEAFSQLFSPYPSVGRVAKFLVSGFGALLVLVSATVAAFAHGDNINFLVSGAHLLEQTVFIIESGLIIFLFLFASYFHLSWDRPSFGILLGLGISSCEHLATWAIIANASPSEHLRTLFAFLNMATYHVSVFIWFYYLLVPGKVTLKPPKISLPENNLAVWNRELERLLQQ